MRYRKTLLLVVLILVTQACLLTGQGALDPTPAPVTQAAAPVIEPTPAVPTNIPEPTSIAAPDLQSAPPEGYVSGGICFPSEGIPPLEIFFQEIDSAAAFVLNTHPGQSGYNIRLPPGTYIAFTDGGLYSPAVACGLTVECTDHSPVEFPVAQGELTTAVDLCDWYGPYDELPEVPADPRRIRSGESIMIMNPGPGARIVSPLQLSGFADPTFEQNLVVRILLADGTEIALAPTTIQADIGQRGPFSIELPFAVSGDQQGFVQVYATSPRDGGVTHLSSVGVLLAEQGSATIIPGGFRPEHLHITSFPIGYPFPESLGGTVHVEGFGLASFEQTLVVDIYDENGVLVGSAPTTVNAPDIGQPGPFSVDVPISITVAGPGRIVVRDISPAFGGDSHLTSAEFWLEP